MRHFMLFAVLLLGTSWAVAQNPAHTQPGQSQANPSDSGPADTGAQNSSTRMSNGNMGAKTIEGCLSESNGNYMLTAKNGKMYNLMGDSSKLGEHVGHTIKVTGTVSHAAESPSGENTGEMANKSGQETIEVSSFKHISKTCENGGGMSR
jgi:hypothetical protein